MVTRPTRRRCPHPRRSRRCRKTHRRRRLRAGLGRYRGRVSRFVTRRRTHGRRRARRGRGRDQHRRRHIVTDRVRGPYRRRAADSRSCGRGTVHQCPDGRLPSRRAEHGRSHRGGDRARTTLRRSRSRRRLRSGRSDNRDRCSLVRYPGATQRHGRPGVADDSGARETRCGASQPRVECRPGCLRTGAPRRGRGADGGDVRLSSTARTMADSTR